MKCSQNDIGLKSYFLGPQAENLSQLLEILLQSTNAYSNWRRSLFPQDGYGIGLNDQNENRFKENQQNFQKLTQELSTRFQKEVPHFSPRYLGHMYSELSLPGLLGHFVALLHNPNNISRESSQVGLKIELEAVLLLCKVFKWASGAGHFTSCGTIANLEALLRMRAYFPAQQIKLARLLTSVNAHYSWKKNLAIAGFPSTAYQEVPLDSNGRLSTKHLKQLLRDANYPILGVVSLFGSTELGTIDDIKEINSLLRQKNIWHHVDAAYGGFFCCAKKDVSDYLKQQSNALKYVDSITIDPHKLGYVPYSCGAFLCRSKKKYFYNNVDAPYINFSKKIDLGIQTIEGSRPATGAAATWLSAKTIGFHANGLGSILSRQLLIKKKFQKQLNQEIKQMIFPKGQDLNILCWTIATSRKSLKDSNKKIESIYKKISKHHRPFYISKTKLNLKNHTELESLFHQRGIRIDTHYCSVARMTLMNPFLMTKESETQFVNEFIEVLKFLIRS